MSSAMLMLNLQNCPHHFSNKVTPMGVCICVHMLKQKDKKHFEDAAMPDCSPDWPDADLYSEPDVFIHREIKRDL